MFLRTKKKWSRVKIPQENFYCFLLLRIPFGVSLVWLCQVSQHNSWIKICYIVQKKSQENAGIAVVGPFVSFVKLKVQELLQIWESFKFKKFLENFYKVSKSFRFSEPSETFKSLLNFSKASQNLTWEQNWKWNTKLGKWQSLRTHPMKALTLKENFILPPE